MSIFTLLLVSISFLSCALGQPQTQPLGTLHRRTYLYVGQTYIPEGNTSIAADQMYVERLTPATVTQPLPILIIHGMFMTGTNFLNTPDGRLGWADYFLSKGYEVYIVDQPSRGRSQWQPTEDGAVERFDLWPQAVLHTQWPGNGTKGDPIFDRFFASNVVSLNSSAEEDMKIKHAGSLLLDQIGPVILMTHSQAGAFGWILADSRPNQVKAIVAMEPTGPPFINAIFPPFTAGRIYGLTDIPVTYDPPIRNASDIGRVVLKSVFYSLAAGPQPPQLIRTSEIPGVTCFQQTEPARKLINLVDIPVLAVTSEASYHAQYDNCSVAFLRQAGVSVEHISLPDVGIHGNAHMFFMEKNNLQIVDTVINPWISKIRS
ncbi:AB hydrolase-1 domain-containing protein [Mycena sanguinolenta]|uniref:AB hydrolase-1 domain-containing protein n=1 Tax=Mycena sanguinolenta TaxID=230812 RepID=A0A8H6Z9Q8_9AGAR|nr:AB hydrolase-1 domain-containing protein [Mycena sanguinolenta]